MNARDDGRNDANRDPVTGAPGSHPIGTGVGAIAGGAAGIAGAAAAGAAAGTVVGPVGTVIGAAIGAVAGGLMGKGVAEMIDPTAEDMYWRDNYSTRPYVTPGSTYDDYGPAYRYGVDSVGKYDGRSFDDVEPQLRDNWNSAKGTSKLEWERAKMATKDSWHRVSDTIERAIPGDSDHDGK
ncbi:MAG: hypothetical protein ABI831_18570 [Betaproteobacteria bacterium]